MQHIIFDLDGTLIDSKDEIFKTYQTVFDQIRPAVRPKTDDLDYGATINNVLKSVYGDDVNSIKDAKQLFMSIYDQSDYRATLLYNGVLETLNALKNMGHELYIATNKRYLPTLRILEQKGMVHLFSGIMANEMEPGITLTKRQMIAGLKKIGAFSSGFMVGDSIGDIHAGNEEQLITVAVKYGYEEESKLLEQKPTYLIDYFHKLSDLVKKHDHI